LSFLLGVGVPPHGAFLLGMILAIDLTIFLFLMLVFFFMKLFFFV
jgi:hypothetical protein